MKYILTALFVSSLAATSAFAADEDCGKCKKKEQGTTLLADDCSKCKKGDKKEEGTLLADCTKCKKGDKKEEGTLVA